MELKCLGANIAVGTVSTSAIIIHFDIFEKTAEVPLSLSGGTDATKSVTLTGRRKGDGSTVLILNTEKIVESLVPLDCIATLLGISAGHLMRS